MNRKTKGILQYGFLICLMLMTSYLVVSTLDIKVLSQIINVIDYRYIAFGFALMIMYIVFEGQVLRLIINSVHGDETKFLGFKIGIMGLYYNLVTPLASGSQPIQIYELTKSKVSPSKAVAVVTNKTVIYQVMVTLYCGVLMIINMEQLKTTLKPVFIFMMMGMTMNVVMLGFGFLVVYSPNKTKKLVNVVLRKLNKFKVFKFLNGKELQINDFIDEYNYSIREFIKDKKTLVKSIVLTFIQLTMYFSIAFCIYKALRLSGVSYFNLLSLQVFLYMAVSSMPTPGNVGANEIAFFAIFKGVIPNAIIGYSVFLYGIFIYYFLLIVCGVFTILYHSRIVEKIKVWRMGEKYVNEINFEVNKGPTNLKNLNKAKLVRKML